MNLFFYTFCIALSIAKYLDPSENIIHPFENDDNIESVSQVEDIIDNVLGDWNPLDGINSNTNTIQTNNQDQPSIIPKIVSVEEDLGSMVDQDDDIVNIFPDQESMEDDLFSMDDLDYDNYMDNILPDQDIMDDTIENDHGIANILPDQEIKEAAKGLIQLKNHFEEIMKESIHRILERPQKKNKLISS